MEFLSLTLAQQQTLHLDSMYWIMLLSRVLHLIGAIILVGGLFYVRMVVSPSDVPSAATPADQLLGGRRATWAKWVGIATALLLITGIWNYLQVINQHERLLPGYHAVAGIKILAAFVLFLLAALLAGRTPAADAIRQNWRRWLNVCLLLGMTAVILGSALRSFPHIRKVNPADAPTLIAPANTNPTQ